MRERNGCLTCRQRKKKCDNNYPICDQCKRLNFTCERQDPRKPKARAGRPRVSSPSLTQNRVVNCTCVLIPPAPNLSSFWIDNGTAVDPSSRRQVMRYYIQTFTHLLTTTAENNCFLSVFLPMSMESPLLLDALAAWSSSHLALRDKSYERIAIVNRCKALNALSTSFSSPDRSPEMELASCLIHCAIESIMGDTKQWFGHLVGAYQVIRSITIIDGTENLDLSRLNTTFEDRWLLKNFAYHDIMMSIAENRKPLLIAGEYWNCGDTFADTYFGLASRLMYLLSEISILNVDMAKAGDVSEIEDSFSVTAQRIHLELVNWTCGPADDMLVNLAETYRSAALIHLFRTIRQNRPQYDTKLTTKIKEQVAEIVRRIQEMPPLCLAESALLLPLFLAGGDADDWDHIASIRQRMQDIIDSHHFHNVDSALTVLEEVWRLRAIGTSGPGGPIDWRDVVAHRKWKLSLV